VRFAAFAKCAPGSALAPPRGAEDRTGGTVFVIFVVLIVAALHASPEVEHSDRFHVDRPGVTVVLVTLVTLVVGS
jgi:hypothetical protein